MLTKEDLMTLLLNTAEVVKEDLESKNITVTINRDILVEITDMINQPIDSFFPNFLEDGIVEVKIAALTELLIMQKKPLKSDVSTDTIEVNCKRGKFRKIKNA